MGRVIPAARPAATGQMKQPYSMPTDRCKPATSEHQVHGHIKAVQGELDRTILCPFACNHALGGAQGLIGPSPAY